MDYYCLWSLGWPFILPSLSLVSPFLLAPSILLALSLDCFGTFLIIVIIKFLVQSFCTVVGLGF